MNKIYWVILVAAAGVAGSLAVTYNWFAPFTNFINNAVTYVSNAVKPITTALTSSPLGTALVTALGSLITGLGIRQIAQTKLNETVQSANTTQDSLLSQLSSATQTITAKQTALDEATAKVTTFETVNTALQNQVADLQAKYNAVLTELSRKQDEYNAALRIQAIAEKLPAPTTAVH